LGTSRVSVIEMAGRIGAKGARGRAETTSSGRGRTEKAGRRAEKAGAGTEVESEGTRVV
jgi:hypothetical protein